MNKIQKSLNLRYGLVMDHYRNYCLTSYDLTLAEEYNQILISNPKYQSRMFIQIDTSKRLIHE